MMTNQIRSPAARPIPPAWRLIFGLLAALVAACAAAPQRDAPGPALWDVGAVDGGRLWLFGTIHRLADSDLWRASFIERVYVSTRTDRNIPPLPWVTPAVHKALATSRAIVIETTYVENGTWVGEALGTLYGNQRPLRELLPAERYAQLAAAGRAYGISERHLERAGPLGALFLFTFIATTPEAESRIGVEYWLENYARRRNLKLEGLETIDERFTALSSTMAGHEVQQQCEILLRYVEDALSDPAREDDAFRRLLALWQTGDIATLDQDMRRFAEAHPEIHQALIVARNWLWIDRLAALIASGRREFVAVGVGHLVGPGNLIELLAERGFTVRRVQ